MIDKTLTNSEYPGLRLVRLMHMGDKPRHRAALLLIGAIQADRRRILMEPGGRDGLDLQGVECDSPTHAVEMRGKERIEHLAEAGMMPRSSSEALLE